MANLTTLLYPVSAAVTNIPNPISAIVTNIPAVSAIRAPTLESRLDTLNTRALQIQNNTANIDADTDWLTPGYGMTDTTVNTYGNYVNSATFEGSLFKITGYNASSTDDYLLIFSGSPSDFNQIYFSSIIKAKQSFEFEFPRGAINGEFTICNSTTPRSYSPGEAVLLLNITYYQY